MPCCGKREKGRKKEGVFIAFWRVTSFQRFASRPFCQEDQSDFESPLFPCTVHFSGEKVLLHPPERNVSMDVNVSKCLKSQYLPRVAPQINATGWRHASVRTASFHGKEQKLKKTLNIWHVVPLSLSACEPKKIRPSGQGSP